MNVMNAEDITLSLQPPGTRFAAYDDAVVPEGKLGLVIQAGSEMTVVIGTAQQLRERVEDGFMLPVPANVPLVDVPDTAAEITGA